MSKRWIVTALGKDRPGIVAGVAQVLYRLRCNLEDSAMTRLGGEFAVMLIFSAPAGAKDVTLQKAFEPLAKRLRLVVHLKPLTVPETRPPSKPGQAYLISVYGADKPGIVFRVTDVLARNKITITDVETHRAGASETRWKRPIYLMLLAVELSPRQDASFLQTKLKPLAKRLGVEVTVRPADADVL